MTEGCKCPCCLGIRKTPYSTVERAAPAPFVEDDGTGATVYDSFVMHCLAALTAVERITETMERQADGMPAGGDLMREAARPYREILEHLNAELSILDWRDERGERLTVAGLIEAMRRGESRWWINEPRLPE